jgi:hypothetical protein
MPTSSKVSAMTGEWECAECGHIVEGSESRRPAGCPECEAPADALEFFSYDDPEEEEWQDEADELDDDFEDEEKDEDDLDDEDEFGEDEDY